MARIQRQELKKDEFVDTFDATLLWVEDHARTLVMAALAIVVGGGSAGAFYWHSQSQERQATEALARALLTYQAPVQAGLPPLLGEGRQQTFSSPEEKYQTAGKEFAAVVAEYPRTRSARRAQYYQALCQLELGEADAAVSTLEELSRSSDRNAAALAKLSLAGFYQKQERRAEAAKLYRELGDQPTETVPRAVALLELATLEAEENPAEARRLYNQIKNEFPDSPIAAEVTRRLELLPAPLPVQP